ncbi:hypothetical protein [Streptomyces sp. NBC_00091]|uniref:hypothetical protein n=1 Tax=Streptomyces sp. NBC_00091 TaxID=2975648 RepID=UPI0022565849|nr:hypothetical protein [Streptomyces sp. NBC_00091]MCX5381558.1 hypothetical protein [Streptomyces sp. NBC_00091]
MSETAQERTQTPAPAVGITDGVVELRKRRPAGPTPDARATAGACGCEAVPADPAGAARE